MFLGKENIVPKRWYIISTYTDKKTLEFTIELVANTQQITVVCVLFYQYK